LVTTWLRKLILAPRYYSCSGERTKGPALPLDARIAIPTNGCSRCDAFRTNGVMILNTVDSQKVKARFRTECINRYWIPVGPLYCARLVRTIVRRIIRALNTVSHHATIISSSDRDDRHATVTGHPLATPVLATALILGCSAILPLANGESDIARVA
jgi:hypothetical protein